MNPIEDTDEQTEMNSHPISNRVNHMRLWVAAAIIAFVVLITFMLSVPHTRDLGVKSPLSSETVSVPVVTLRDVFKKGLHTITGSVEASNACATASAEANMMSDASSTQSILVAISMHTDIGTCLQLPTPISFQTTITAPAHLPIIATVNGTAATVSTP